MPGGRPDRGRTRPTACSGVRPEARGARRLEGVSHVPSIRRRPRVPGAVAAGARADRPADQSSRAQPPRPPYPRGRGRLPARAWRRCAARVQCACRSRG